MCRRDRRVVGGIKPFRPCCFRTMIHLWSAHISARGCGLWCKQCFSEDFINELNFNLTEHNINTIMAFFTTCTAVAHLLVFLLMTILYMIFLYFFVLYFFFTCTSSPAFCAPLTLDLLTWRLIISPLLISPLIRFVLLGFVLFGLIWSFSVCRAGDGMEYLQAKVVFREFSQKDFYTRFTCVALSPAGFAKEHIQVRKVRTSWPIWSCFLLLLLVGFFFLLFQ